MKNNLMTWAVPHHVDLTKAFDTVREKVCAILWPRTDAHRSLSPWCNISMMTCKQESRTTVRHPSPFLSPTEWSRVVSWHKHSSATCFLPSWLILLETAMLESESNITGKLFNLMLKAKTKVPTNIRDFLLTLTASETASETLAKQLTCNAALTSSLLLAQTLA